MMALLRILTAHAPNRVFLSIVLGVGAGICYAVLIPLLQLSFEPIVRGSQASETPLRLFGLEIWHQKIALAYLGACLLVLVLRTVSQLLLTRVSVEMVSALRMRVYQHVMATGTRNLEELGPSRVTSVLNIDVFRVVTGARMLPDALISFVSVAGMLAFVWVLSPPVFKYIVLAIVVGAASYQLVVSFAARFLWRARHEAEKLQESLRRLLYGAKELKLDASKRRDFLQLELAGTEAAWLGLEKRGQTLYRAGMNYGDLLGFFVIGFIAFSASATVPLTPTETAGVVMALLYLTAPVALLLNYAPHIAQAKVSLKHVDALFSELPPEPAEEDIVPVSWSELRFEDVTFSYSEAGMNESRQFTVGPLSFTVKKGQVVFIVGGNGSGKSTLGKLLSLHYRAQGGRISFGDHEVTTANLASCRQAISAIFADFFLFETLLGNATRDAKTIQALLAKLGLSHKVEWRDERFSTLALSQGQRKRLALLVSFLEDKQLYVFDEWAADQDPEFKDFFYRELLPELRAGGKAVVVISHDEKYFDAADALIRMDAGKIAQVHSFEGVSPGPTAARTLQGTL